MKPLRAWLLRFDLNGLWMVFWIPCSLYFYCLGYSNVSDAVSINPTRQLLACALGLIACFILEVTSYFDIVRIIPRKSDFILLLFAVCASGSIMAIIDCQLLGGSSLEWRRLLVTGPLFSILLSVGYNLITVRLVNVRKRRITLKLRAEESVEFIEFLQTAGLWDQIEIVPAANVLGAFIKGQGPAIDLIIISQLGARDMQTDRFLLRAYVAGITIIDYRECMETLRQRVSTDNIDAWSFIASAKSQSVSIRLERQLRLFVEPVIALILILLLSPLFAVMALLICVNSPGPVLYAQRRTGYLGRTFMLYKFRSMRVDSEQQGYRWAQKNDPRITSVGRFLRKTRLDELPQLWNVVIGDMSFIGPRPERPEIYHDLIATVPLFSLRTDVRPGITGWAQVCAGYAASVEESKIKLEHDLYYIQHMSPRLDLVIVIMTLKIVMFGNEFIPGKAATCRTEVTARTEAA